MKFDSKIQKITIMVLLVIFLGLTTIIPVSFAQNEKTNVIYLGEETENIAQALKLDEKSIDLTISSTLNFDGIDLNDFDAVVINDVVLSNSDINYLRSWGEIEDHGILVVMGPQLTQDFTLLIELEITTASSLSNNSGYVETQDDLREKKGLSLVNDALEEDDIPILSSIVWNTAPETFYFTLISDLEPEVTSIINMQLTDEEFTETDYPLISARSIGVNTNLNVYVMSGWFQDEYDDTNSNEHYMVWLYFNYLIYATVQSTVNYPNIESYGQWDHSPVPHTPARIILGLSTLFIAILSVGLYYYARKNKKTHREIFVPEEKIDATKTEEEIDESHIDENLIDKDDKWEVIGMHRQIAGFFKLFFVMIMLIIPQLVVTSFVMPQFLNPFAQASGWYSYTLRFFEAIWLVFDMGFNFAITKYFAQHRLERPEKAYHYVQLFIWWEILSGVIQVLIVAFMGSFIFPLTDFSYLSWMFVIHSLIQFPGIFLVFQYFFQGYQRADYNMIAFALQYFVLRLVLQVATVPIFKAIFANNVMYGPAFGAGIGLLIGQLLGDWVLFGITLKMYKNLKLPLLPVFTADFTKEEFVETFKFGGKMIIGQMWVPLGWLLQVYLVGIFLPNSSAEQGFFELAFTVSTIPQAISLLMAAMMGSLTEAYEYKKENLHSYTTFSGFKWGSIWTFYLVSTFLAIGPDFILGASGPNWARAAALVPLMMFYRALGPTSWQADYEFAAVDKPAYAGLAWVIEQSVRAVLTYWLLVTMRRMEAVIIAYIISLTIKSILVIILIRWKIHKWEWNVWQTYIAPLLAAVVNWLILKGILFLVVDVIFGGENNIINAVILFVIGMFGMEYVYAFLMGLFGGFCDNTLEELDLATEMVTGVHGLTRFYYKMVAAGAKISPLHNKFKVKVYEAAWKEAEELTAIKKRVVK